MSHKDRVLTWPAVDGPAVSPPPPRAFLCGSHCRIQFREALSLTVTHLLLGHWGTIGCDTMEGEGADSSWLP